MIKDMQLTNYKLRCLQSCVKILSSKAALCTVHVINNCYAYYVSGYKIALNPS